MTQTIAQQALCWARQARQNGALNLDQIPQVDTSRRLDNNEVWNVVGDTIAHHRALGSDVSPIEFDLALFFALRLKGLDAELVLAKEISPAGDNPSITTWVEVDGRVVSTGLDVAAGLEAVGRLGQLGEEYPTVDLAGTTAYTAGP